MDFGREVPLFEVEATVVEPEFEKLYSYLFDIENGGFPVEEMDRPRPTAIFVVNFDKVSTILIGPQMYNSRNKWLHMLLLFLYF